MTVTLQHIFLQVADDWAGAIQPGSLAHQISVVLLWLGLVGLMAASVTRWSAAKPEMIRKIVHIGVGNVILIAWWLALPRWLGISASLFFSAIALLSHYLPVLPMINSIGRKSFGTFFYAISFAVLIGWFWEPETSHYAVIGILVMSWGDGLAALIGKRFGRHRYQLWGMEKSWEGTLTMALISYAVSWGVLFSVQGNIGLTWSVSLAIALVAASLEAFSKLGIDNITVPIGSTITAFLLNSYLA